MAGTVKNGLAERARACLEEGDYEQCRQTVLAALETHPDDPELLRLAGLAGLELGSDDAVAYLQKASAAAPGDARIWSELGDALVVHGRSAEAADAFRQAVSLRPDDVDALVHLGHSAFAAGRTDEAISALGQAANAQPGSAAVLRPLADIYRRAGRLEEALGTAERLAGEHPEDVLAVLDVAELNLELGRLDAAVGAFGRLRTLDEDPEHEVYAYHGMIEAEIRRERWRRALDLAVDATRADRHGRTTDVLAFVVAKVFGESDRPAPERGDVDEALSASRAEHRRLHEEALVVL
jgi:tetratricopeptide (TPR) repeat protein